MIKDTIDLTYYTFEELIDYRPDLTLRSYLSLSSFYYSWSKIIWILKNYDLDV